MRSGREGGRIVPLRGARGMIADKMSASLREAAQLTLHARADMSILVGVKGDLAAQGTQVSVEDLLMAVLVQVLKRHPNINGTVRGREVHLSDQVDLGVALALPGNLLAAPAIFDADSKSLPELHSARQGLLARAKVNQLSVAEMTGGTFTISNLGLSRVEQFTPIINTPQIAILGIGRLVETPVRSGDNLVWHPFAGLSLTFDHRAIDGAPAAEFLTDLCDAVERCKP